MDDKERITILKNLIPVPQEISFDDKEDYILEENSPVLLTFGGKKDELKIAEGMLLDSFAAYWKRTPDLTCKSGKKDAPSGEGYNIEVKQELLSIKVSTLTGLQNAMKTLRQLAEPVRNKARTEDFFLVSCSIKDSPVFTFRGIHICIFPETPLYEVEKKIRLAAYHKFNYAVIEVWGHFPFVSHPEMCWKDRKIDLGELKRLVRLGKELGITLCPQFNLLGHAAAARGSTGKHAFLDFAPELQVLFEPGGWTWCLSNPYTRQTLADIVSELLEFFDFPPYFHIGCDESLDFASCKTCRKSNKEKLLLDHITFFNDLIKSKGARTIMWHDMLLIGGVGSPYEGYYAFGSESDGLKNLYKKLPKDIIIADWQYNYPKKPDSTDEPTWPTSKVFHDAGLDVVVCPWLNTDGIISQAKMAKERSFMGMLETTWHMSHTYPQINAQFTVAANGAWRGDKDMEMPITFWGSNYSIATHRHMREVCLDMGITEYEKTGFSEHQVMPDAMLY
ncbi:MAG: family 20 glycosylhydrolase [Lentisphaeria bacterium]|nr:family 20 glycosylhydrolase [Lentisphaeria bacterium]